MLESLILIPTEFEGDLLSSVLPSHLRGEETNVWKFLVPEFEESYDSSYLFDGVGGLSLTI